MIEIIKIDNITHKVILKDDEGNFIADISDHIGNINIGISPFNARDITVNLSSLKTVYKEEGAG
jgi:hypothetical protein